jgi:hypothetical protein
MPVITFQNLPKPAAACTPPGANTAKIAVTLELARLSVRFRTVNTVRFRTMEDDADAEIVASVAKGFVGKLGRDAVPYLRFEGTLATGKGDDLSAEAWHDIADAAAFILTRLN